jgi:hypothetical protein
LAAIASKYISPENFWFLAFFGLAFPIVLILNICFVIFWVAQFRIQAIFSIIAILFSAKTCLGFVQIDYRNSVIEKKDIKIMSYNAMLFDLYHWSKDTKSRKTILTNIAQENPEILCLQEFYTSEEKGDFNNNRWGHDGINSKSGSGGIWTMDNIDRRDDVNQPS